MITRWRLFNFKSVRADTTLTCAPLTVITGANSAGKSTVLQSMLMVAQTVRSPALARAMVLNGPLVRLGAFTSVRTEGSGEAQVFVGFTLESHRGAHPPVQCEVTLDEDGEGAGPDPRLVASEVRYAQPAGASGSAETSAFVRRADETPAERAKKLGLRDDDEGLLESLKYELLVESNVLGVAGRAEGLRLAHFLARDGIRVDVTAGVPVLSPYLPPAGVVAPLQTIVQQWSTVRYIGPLRQEPQPFYPLVASADPADVGVRGENAAAVLHQLRAELVAYVGTEGLQAALSGSAGGVEGRLRTLEAAVGEWLTHLGVVERVETHDLGAIYEMKASLPGESTMRDLTQMGTGVSQVLPVVLACLLTTPGGTVLIEQPEVHLHPSVQTRLADFFLAMMLSGRQVIVETHSEYIVNRLRYRIAAAAGDSLLPLVKIYFAEKKDGASTFRPLVLDRYGSIVEWPDGFFDDSQLEIERILLAGADKMEADADRLDAQAREGGDATGG